MGQTHKEKQRPREWPGQGKGGMLEGSSQSLAAGAPGAPWWMLWVLKALPGPDSRIPGHGMPNFHEISDSCVVVPQQTLIA